MQPHRVRAIRRKVRKRVGERQGFLRPFPPSLVNRLRSRIADAGDVDRRGGRRRLTAIEKRIRLIWIRRRSARVDLVHGRQRRAWCGAGLQ